MFQSDFGIVGKLIRKKRVLEKFQFSKSTLHAKLNKNSRYFDPTFPQPIYLPSSRMPLWDENALDRWVISLASHTALRAVQSVPVPIWAHGGSAYSASTPNILGGGLI